MYIMFNHPRLYRKVLAFCNSCYSRSLSIDPATYHDVFALFYTSLVNYHRLKPVACKRLRRTKQ